MNLLHVISGMDPRLGGVCQAVRTIAAGLVARGVHNEVVSLDAPNPAWYPVDSFTLHALGPGCGPWCYGPKLIPWLLVNLGRFDAVLLHGLWLYPSYALRKALRRLKDQHPAANRLPRLFVMPHGMLDPYFQRASGRKIKAWRNRAYWHLVEGAVINEASGVLFTCETERQLAHESFSPYHPRQEIVVGLGIVEPPPYTAAMQVAFASTCPDLQNRPYLLFIGRLHEKKGTELLLQAYAKILHSLAPLAANSSPKAPFPTPVLIIAGPGLETTYGQHLRQLATKLPEATVLFPGMLMGEAKWGAFYGCEAFVLPSHQENFGIAVVEALACRKPVLISNQVNIWREIAAAGGGLVQQNTLTGTHQLLKNWLKLTQPQKHTMAALAKVTYQKYFAIGTVTEKFSKALLK